MTGLFISFEGIDFCGKSVQIERLTQKLSSNSLDFVLLREPGGTIISEKIREMLLTKEQEKMNPITEYLLFSAARAQITSSQILPALKNGKIVICDRYFDSSTAYQGFGRGIELVMIHQINRLASSGQKPDRTFLIDIDLAEMEKRKKARLKNLDRMEHQALDFFTKVREGYLSIAKKEPERFVVIDGKKSVNSIADQIWKEVQELL